MIDAMDSSSTRPYLIRALYEWCTDNGFTPYVAVRVESGVQVPTEYVKDGEIVLNISFDATSSLKLGNEFIEFKARFGGTAREIQVPISHVLAIYARENGQGMAFSSPIAGKDAIKATVAPDSQRDAGSKHSGADQHPVYLTSVESNDGSGSSEDAPPEPPRTPGGPRPVLKRVK